MKKLGWFLPLLLTVGSTIFGLFLGEWLQIVSAPLFSTETRTVLTSLLIIGLLLLVAVVSIVFFAQRTEQREQKWLQIENRLGTPAEIDFEPVTRKGKFNRRLAEYVRNVTAGDEILIMSYYAARGGEETPQESAEYKQSLKEYSRILLEKAREPGIIYRRIISFDDSLEQGNIKAGRVKQWLIDHAKNMLEIKKAKPDKITLKKGRVVFRSDLLIIKDKIAVISLDVFEPKSGQFRTDGALIFHNPPNSNIIQQLYELFMAADNESVPIEKVPEE